jgi:hypothetical protein
LFVLTFIISVAGGGNGKVFQTNHALLLVILGPIRASGGIVGIE